MKYRLFNALALAALVLTVACAAPSGTSADPGSLPLDAKALPLTAGDPLHAQIGRLRYRGGLELTSSNILFGGLSGLDISADGARMVAMSDNGRWVGATLLYDKGDLSGVAGGVMKPIKRVAGYNRPGNWRDAESIAPDASGGYYVAFERQHRIWHYRARPKEDPMDVEPVELKGPDVIAQQPLNSGIEGLTRLCDRRLLAISEDAASGPGAVKAWVFDGKQWKSLSYATTGSFKPTDAATLPDCNLVVLERSFSLAEGVRARVVFIQAKAIRPGATLRGDEIALMVPPVSVDNMEGIAARRGEHGETLLYLVSDNNFSGFQRTLLMMFELLPPPEAKAGGG
jgi:hypothetical protein